MADFSGINNKIKKLIDYLTHDVPEVIGTEAVNHFQESFQNEGFTDESLKKWDAPKRKDKSSTWYGFKYRAKSARPGRTRRKANSITNFSPAATKRPTLSGSTKQLRRSISYKVQRGKVIVYSDSKYAKIHNKGGKMKVFGKASATMPQRKFMGKSKKLRRKIGKEIQNDINKILR